MDDVHTPNSQEPPDACNSVKDGTPQSQIHQHRIDHATTVTVDNDCYTTIYTLEIRLSKDDIATATNTTHHRIFDAIKEIDDSVVIISLDQLMITHGKEMPAEKEYMTVLKDWRKCNVTKREYISFKLESNQ